MQQHRRAPRQRGRQREERRVEFLALRRPSGQGSEHGEEHVESLEGVVYEESWFVFCLSFKGRVFFTNGLIFSLKKGLFGVVVWCFVLDFMKKIERLETSLSPLKISKNLQQDSAFGGGFSSPLGQALDLFFRFGFRVVGTLGVGFLLWQKQLYLCSKDLGLWAAEWPSRCRGTASRCAKQLSWPLGPKSTTGEA